MLSDVESAYIERDQDNSQVLHGALYGVQSQMPLTTPAAAVLSEVATETTHRYCMVPFM